MAYVAIVKSARQVEVRDAATARYICMCPVTQGNAVGAVVTGDYVAINLHNGKVEVRDARTGNYVRTT